ncbi:hypothetical protein GCM10010885_11870 [Alicyclobacillus cellulosilyticus]|uniref:Sec-independent protein translocase protein TatA n=1 Tax=Alicyclobacillus cellulosilyticus TaxID=1003997 RepID=A0A917NJ15_9BACL|nr:twin-arginine translocase TatA/TatE family subunit [Alicyclobacillus cellulosilyticus]GGJ04215.1 hypothetical protein GCM10010885_11870 [Alicyclobacillus cellulosilyticus]
MNFANVGISGLILIVIVLLMVFGPSKLPEIGRAFGRSLREFREATRGMMDEQGQATGQARSGAPERPVVEPLEIQSEPAAHARPVQTSQAADGQGTGTGSAPDASADR